MVKYYFLDNKSIYDLAKFIVEENYDHHTANTQQIQREIEEVYQEELALNNSKIVVSREENLSIVGSIRVLKWNNIDILPIEKLFNIKISDIDSNKNNEIWHIGRFAIKKGVDKMGFNVFKTLMTCAINEVCKSENSFALAECDVKLLRILNLLGIETIVLADSINYLGSETLPVMLPYKGLKSFLDKNIHLLPPNFTFLHQSVVIRSVTKNYTIV